MEKALVLDGSNKKKQGKKKMICSVVFDANLCQSVNELF